MVSHLFFYHLVLVALVWLCVMLQGCIGKKGATYAAFFRGVTNVGGVSRSWIAAGR